MRSLVICMLHMTRAFTCLVHNLSNTGAKCCLRGLTQACGSAQVVQVCAEHKKPRKLLKHLEAARAAGRAQRNPPRCLVFTNRVKTAKFVAKTLSEAGHRVALLHGQRPQNEREVTPLRLLLVSYELYALLRTFLVSLTWVSK